MLECLTNAKLYFVENFTEKNGAVGGGEPRTRWRSIWISTIVAFIESITASSLTPSVWPYMKQVGLEKVLCSKAKMMLTNFSNSNNSCVSNHGLKTEL